MDSAERARHSENDLLPSTRLMRCIQPSARIERVLEYGCSLVAFLLPLKLALTYAILIPLLLAYLLTQREKIRSMLLTPVVSSVAAPVAFLIVMAFISAVFGLSLSHSLPSLISLAFFTLTILLYSAHAAPLYACSALVAGQTIAALHSFLDAAYPNTIPSLFLGKVTESGQLAITILVAIGLLLSSKRLANLNSRTSTGLALSSLISTFALLTIAYRIEAGIPSTIQALTILTLGCSLLFGLFTSWQLTSWSRLCAVLYTYALPFMVCALVVNLKRGPWLGVLVGASVFLLPRARKAVPTLLLAACTIAYIVSPVRDRLLASYEHFTISGGRSTIWRIGAELASEYPLGIGYHNSGILRQFAPEIPPELKHFHNNLINIAAETGWLGLAVFVWLIASAIRMSYSERRDAISVSIGCAIIAWQVAGLVEYNFGDSEITILVWALLGVALRAKNKPSLIHP